MRAPMTCCARAVGFVIGVAAAAIVLAGSAARVRGGELDVAKRMEGFDAYMAKVLKDWNAPAVAVGVVVGDRLVFAKGYGYRDYGKKLPFTSRTLCPIASNSKLFTAVAAGMLVEEGKLSWDRPIRQCVPEIRFYDDALNNTVTLRDMLGHRTGITRHDAIWYQSAFSRKELFERTRYLEPREPIRQCYLYNNLMFAAVGYIIELKSGKTWEEFVRERILAPLEMQSTVYSIPEMLRQPDHGVPYTEWRDSDELYQMPYYEDTKGMAPAGAIISNIEEVSHWLAALMNKGKYRGKQVLPVAVLAATMGPGIAQPNPYGETLGYWELLNPAYGMGRVVASYRGRLLTYHNGDLGGFHSQISLMPHEGIGVVVFVIGDHCAKLSNFVSYNVYERLLGIDQTPWSERMSTVRNKGKQAGTEARAQAGAERVAGTKPSHALADYAGEFEHPAYGVVHVRLKDGRLVFDFNKQVLPLSRFHYDRFDTPDDELYGKFSLNFGVNPQGDVDRFTMFLDEAAVEFVRKPDAVAPELLRRLAGDYESPSGETFHVGLRDGRLRWAMPGQPSDTIMPYKGLRFRARHNPDLVVEFLLERGRVTGLRQIDPTGVLTFKRK